ncbi:hypothetical protein F5884DRAFT_805980 [Xylogone sp. PMI_703]|nr:hypothetical protein F5884DRAFT_805980 [Xylogone sp. PMI_703]
MKARRRVDALKDSLLSCIHHHFINIFVHSRLAYDEISVRVMRTSSACYLCSSGKRKCSHTKDSHSQPCNRCTEGIPPGQVPIKASAPLWDSDLASRMGVLPTGLNPVLQLMPNPYSASHLTVQLLWESTNKQSKEFNFEINEDLSCENCSITQAFDDIIRHNFWPDLELKHVPPESVSNACLAYGYLRLFFWTKSIKDQSPIPHNHNWPLLIGSLILTRLTTLIHDILEPIRTGQVASGSWLPLIILHSQFRRIKCQGWKSGFTRPFYVFDIARILKMRTNRLEHELRMRLQVGCGGVDDWATLLESPRRQLTHDDKSIPLTELCIKFHFGDKIPENDPVITSPTELIDPNPTANAYIPDSFVGGHGATIWSEHIVTYLVPTNGSSMTPIILNSYTPHSQVATMESDAVSQQQSHWSNSPGSPSAWGEDLSNSNTVLYSEPNPSFPYRS